MPRTENWELRYNTAKQFYDAHGHLNMSHWDGRFIDGTDIYQWLKYQRKKYREGKLEDEKIQLLNNIGIIWGNARIASWDSNYELAKQYYEKNGTLDVPQTLVLDNDFKLGMWVHVQRTAYRNGTLKEDRKLLLDELGFDEISHNRFDNRWDEHLALARKYHSIYGTINVERDFVYEGVNLGNWITNAMAWYQRGILKEERIKQLEELGIHWSRTGNEEFTWERNYAQLKTFLMGYSIDELTIESNSIIYNWLERQKYLIETNQLEEDKLNQLLDLGISLERRTKSKDNWDHNYQLAKDYYEKHGHLLITKDYKTENGENLGFFLQGKRNAYNGNGKWKITQEQIDLLNQIDMVWGSLPEARWYYNLKVLKEYLENTEVPFPMSRSLIYKKIELGKFLYDTQVKIRNNKLPEQQLQDILAVLPNIETVETLTEKQNNRIKAKALEEERKEKQKEFEESLKEMTPQKTDVVVSPITDDPMEFVDFRMGRWIENFKSLREYLVLNPTIPVNTNELNKFKPNLASWVYQYVNAYKDNSLRPYQVELLNSLNIDLQRLFPLNKEQKWLRYYDLLIHLLESDDIFTILKKYPDLQAWYSYNLRKLQENKLNVFRKEKFNLLMDKIDNC